MLKNPLFSGWIFYFAITKICSIKVKFVNILFWLAVVGADIIVYVIIGIALMGYDDNWDASKGEYGSWKSMTNFDRTAFTTLYLWHTLNIIFWGWAVWKLYRMLRTKYTKSI
jgi:hypothetical protein